jgi:hypothetical protein
VRRTLFAALAGAGTTVAGSAGATATAQAGAALGGSALTRGASKVSVTAALWLVGGGVAGFAIATPVAMYAASPAPVAASAQLTALQLSKPRATPTVEEAMPPASLPVSEPVTLPPVDLTEPPRRDPAAVNAPAGGPAKEERPSVSAEVDLLKNAQRALSAGDARTALALLDQHELKFPVGALVAERMAAQVFALCELGRVQEARSVAGAFLAAAPNSPLVPRVTASCAGATR